MSDKLHGFNSDAITVTWSKRRCIHAAECVAGLPRVFQPGERPWIKLEHAAAEHVADIVRRCPTGALHYEPLDGATAEAPPESNTVRVTPNGPTYLYGDIEIRNEQDDVLLKDTRVALCRCGGSANKPFCDNSHRGRGFHDAGNILDEDAVQGPGTDSSGRTLVVTLHTDGPIELSGPFVLGGADGQTMLSGTSTWLCRCGQSADKPFCDSSHTRSGFQAP